MKFLLPVIAFSLMSGAALGAAPAIRHPAGEAVRVADQSLPYEGRVVSAIDVGGYVYIEVSTTNQTAWIAAPQMAPVKKGDMIEFGEGTIMTNYYSKTLKKTFPTVMFVNKVVVSTGTGNKH